MASSSMSFDRAAGYYDQSRSDRPETIARVVDLIRDEVAGRDLCLEIGVGTGRIGLPLARSGVRLAGVDLSAAMVARLVEKAGGDPPLMLAIADTTALPFAEGSFGAALASHVFHLIPNWRGAVGEVVRVVRPGGLVLVELGGLAPLNKDLRETFAQAVGLAKPFPGTESPQELDAEFEALGARARVLPEIDERIEMTAEALIRPFELGQLSCTWQLDETVRRHGAAELRRWAAAALGPGPQEVVKTIRLHAYELPDI